MRGVLVGAGLGQQRGCLGAVVARPELGLDDGVDHLLRPLGTVVQILLMHEHHAASMVAPDIASEALHPADFELFGQGVEGFGDDVAGDAFTGQRGRHVRRRQHHQIHLIRRQSAAGRLAHRHQPVIAKQLLHHHVVNRVPKRNRHRLPAQQLDLGDARGHGQTRAADMVPGHHFGRDLAAIAGPHGHRRQQVNHVDLPRNKRLDHLRPTAQQHRALGLDAFGFEQAVVMRHQQRRGIGDRQVADAHRGIRLRGGAGLQAVEQRQGAGRGQQSAEFEEVTTCVSEVVQAHGQSPTVRAKVG
ncbi:hypothetical protein D3C86_1400720 [compost metagenome]